MILLSNVYYRLAGCDRCHERKVLRQFTWHTRHWWCLQCAGGEVRFVCLDSSVQAAIVRGYVEAEAVLVGYGPMEQWLEKQFGAARWAALMAQLEAA